MFFYIYFIVGTQDVEWDPHVEKLVGELLWQRVYEEIEILSLWHTEKRKTIERLRKTKELFWSAHALEDKITGMILYKLSLPVISDLLKDK